MDAKQSDPDLNHDVSVMILDYIVDDACRSFIKTFRPVTSPAEAISTRLKIQDIKQKVDMVNSAWITLSGTAFTEELLPLSGVCKNEELGIIPSYILIRMHLLRFLCLYASRFDLYIGLNRETISKSVQDSVPQDPPQREMDELLVDPDISKLLSQFKLFSPASPSERQDGDLKQGFPLRKLLPFFTKLLIEVCKHPAHFQNTSDPCYAQTTAEFVFQAVLENYVLHDYTSDAGIRDVPCMLEHQLHNILRVEFSDEEDLVILASAVGDLQKRINQRLMDFYVHGDELSSPSSTEGEVLLSSALLARLYRIRTVSPLERFHNQLLSCLMDINEAVGSPLLMQLELGKVDHDGLHLDEAQVTQLKELVGF